VVFVKKRTWASILLVIGTVITPLAIITLWLNSTLLNTNQYVATIAPLSKNQAIASDLADSLANRVFTQVPVQQEISAAIPVSFQFLAPILTQELKNFFTQETEALITSDQFNQVWISLNRFAHEQIVALLTGQGGALVTKNGQVTLDLQAIFDQVKTRLSQKGITLFQNVTLSAENNQVVLFQSQFLAQAQSFISLIAKLRIILPILALAAFIFGIILYSNYARGLFWTGIGLLLVGIALIIIIAIARSSFPSYTPNLSPTASAAFYDTIVRYLQNAAWITITVGLILTLVFFFISRREAKS